MKKLVALGLIGGIIWFNSTDMSENLLSQTPAKLMAKVEQIFSYANSDEEALYTVKRVVDGDTIYVQNAQGKHKVRLLGIDTPELAHRGNPRECFAQEATQFLKQNLAGQTVRLQRDITQKDTDKYGRLLRYVYLEGATHSINYTLVKEGYGFEYTYNIPYQKQDTFQKAQHSARVNDRGLWNPHTCNGVVSQ